MTDSAPKTAVIIVAAGRGTRAGAGLPKQYRQIQGQTVLTRTLLAFARLPAITEIVTVIHPDDRSHYDAAAEGMAKLHPPVTGGESRADSVRAGLLALASDPPDYVLIHDAARPFVSPQLVEQVIERLAHVPGALVALPVIDALWQGDQTAENAIDRTNMWRAQTPQGFHYAPFVAAFKKASGDEKDDAEIDVKAGLEVSLVYGEPQNRKLTTEEDFIKTEATDIRTGIGYDVHAFKDGDQVTLCGISLPHDRALKGHSDADVAMHAITDAIFGAMADGDIGQWFPPSDPEWKGAASDIFLRKAIERTATLGFAITHIDCTIICERPKIGPHTARMRARLAEILNITEDRVSVKATTSERLGFTGREEGIAAMATATLRGL